MVHMNHIKRVYDIFPPTEHGLGASDVNRHDRQNWRSVQKLSFPKVRNCLMKLIDGRAPTQRPTPNCLVLHGNIIILQQRGFTTGANKVLRHRDTISGNLARTSSSPPYHSHQYYYQGDVHVPKCLAFLSLCRSPDMLHERQFP